MGFFIMFDENTFHLISKWLKCRDAMKRMWGEEYPAKVKPYIAIIEAEKNIYGTDNPLEAAIDIADRCPDLLNTTAVLLLFSAAIEIKD